MNDKPGTILLLQETRRQLAEAQKDRTAYWNRIQELTTQWEDVTRRLHRFARFRVELNRQHQELEFCLRIPDFIAKELGTDGVMETVLAEVTAQLHHQIRSL